ncbi:MAG TPA: hypothetical protein PLL26_02470 [Candidatus Dojkabacteria bacterium]|nr:hypothetical protein [Candidatus Dojkabacteria bacterium]
MAQNPGQKLESIFSYSFPANHLLQFSIVKQEAEQSYKKAFFCFITLAPGVQNQQGGRTFDFNNRITMKVEAYQITELSHALRAFARGQEGTFGQFSIYVDSGKSQFGQGGGGKSMTIQKTANQKQGNAPMVTFFFKSGTNQALGYSISPYRALAIADKLEFIGKKCDELEFSRGSIAPQMGTYENPNPMGFTDNNPTNVFGTPQTMSPDKSKPQSVAGNFANTFQQFDFDEAPF